MIYTCIYIYLYGDTQYALHSGIDRNTFTLDSKGLDFFLKAWTPLVAFTGTCSNKLLIAHASLVQTVIRPWHNTVVEALILNYTKLYYLYTL